MRKKRVGSRLLGLFLSSVLMAGCAGTNPQYNESPDGSGGGGADAGDGSVQCQLVKPQSGCAAGQKCTTHDTVKTWCDPDGDVNRGGRCKSLSPGDDCYAGNACAAAGGGIGICRAFCHTDSDCGARSYCELPLGTSGMMMCTQSCNPIGIGAGCAPGMACYVFDFEHTDCRLPGTASEQQACIKSDDCMPGMVCLGKAGAARCLPVCEQGRSVDCPGNETCYNVQDDNGTPWSTYGGCM